MRLSTTELNILKQIADGNNTVKKIATSLKRSQFQIYRSGQNLTQEGFVQLQDGKYMPVKNTHSSMLLQLLVDYPSVIVPFSSSGLNFFKLLLKPQTISTLLMESGLKSTQVYKKIKQARGVSLIKKTGEKYVLNDKLWSVAIEFLSALKNFEETSDKRVPANSIIYYKNEEEIVFSNKETLDATKTAFSAYEDYGIKLLNITHYYHLPKKKLSKQEVLIHSLYIIKKENNDVRLIILAALLYAKFLREFSRIKHPLLHCLNKVFEGQRIIGYPSLEEIKNRAEMYDIRL